MTRDEKRARAARAAALLDELIGGKDEATQLPDPPPAKGAGRTPKVLAPARDRHPVPGGKAGAAEQREPVAPTKAPRESEPVPPYQKRKGVAGTVDDYGFETYGVLTPLNGINERHWPKKHDHGSLVRGTSVWYRGERWWVEYAPPHWSKGCYARISDKAVHPDPARPLPSEMGGPVTTFCVHADVLELAPTRGNLYTRQPSLAGVARAERAKAGIRDVGDDIAALLRDCETADAMYAAGAKYLGVEESSLRERYGHLNPGQQRMNIGNRLRSLWKKGLLKLD